MLYVTVTATVDSRVAEAIGTLAKQGGGNKSMVIRRLLEVAMRSEHPEIFEEGGVLELKPIVKMGPDGKPRKVRKY